MLCIDCMQSFCNHADFDNLNVHVTKQFACRWESQIECKTTREITYENHLILHFVVAIMRIETEHSCVWSVEND